MAYFIIDNPISAENNIARMREDARYEIADDTHPEEECPLDMEKIGAIRSPKALPKVPKMFLSNNCIFNCAYCNCRTGNDENRRYCNNPRELARMAVDQSVRNRHGVFITSAIHKNPDYTEELIIETMKVMRNELGYNGYIHAKVMPGTDPLLIRQAGLYADRLSVNIEVARSEGYKKLARQKTKENILTPMQQISDLIKAAKTEKGGTRRKFAVSQTTQLMAGSTGEDDRTIMILAKALYRKYGLKRVYYTPFQYRHEAKGYDLPFTTTPAWRVRRLYQADRLQQLYGFAPDEITPEQEPNLAADMDPKAAWALRNLHLFPVEVNKADFEMLIRVPGIGITYARRIIQARTYCNITHDILKKIGIPLKKSGCFITCQGRYIGEGAFNEISMRLLLSDANDARFSLLLQNG